MFGRINKLRKELELKDIELASQAKRIASLNAKLLKTEDELARAKEMIDSAPFFKKGQNIGPVTILEAFKVDQEVHFREVVAAGLVLFGAVACASLVCGVVSRPRDSRSDSDWHFRFYDHQTRSVKEMKEGEMKEYLQKNEKS